MCAFRALSFFFDREKSKTLSAYNFVDKQRTLKVSEVRTRVVLIFR